MGAVALAVAAVGTATAVFNIAYTNDEISTPFVQTAVLRQGKNQSWDLLLQMKSLQWQ